MAKPPNERVLDYQQKGQHPAILGCWIAWFTLTGVVQSLATIVMAVNYFTPVLGYGAGGFLAILLPTWLASGVTIVIAGRMRIRGLSPLLLLSFGLFLASTACFLANGWKYAR